MMPKEVGLWVPVSVQTHLSREIQMSNHQLPGYHY